ncbi:hypothetical protein Sps_02144 [Shewanella psychrophila]|uniref:Uncharacterized protein n=1 Tax=Shewanella psychrophila TaxID=225848 RepID=A0A1S6HP72_9GAMM|nr:hypothetical protein Sps_02144 [Shewanella psychrophila]
MRHFSRLKHIKHIHRSAHIRRMRFFTSQHTANNILFGLPEQIQDNDPPASEDSEELVIPVDKTA